MKQVTRCENCRRIIKRNGSFTAELEEIKTYPDGVTYRAKNVIKLCRPCASEAGYKVKGEDGK